MGDNGTFILIHVYMDKNQNIDEGIKKFATALQNDPSEIDIEEMPCGSILPPLNKLVQRVLEKKDWPCPCKDPSHWIIKIDII